jgi:hypothetical protein
VITEAGKAQMAELDARRTAHLRGERPWVDEDWDEDDGRHPARSIGALSQVAPGWEVWTTEGGRRDADDNPLGGIVLHVDAGAPNTVDEWGEIQRHPARYRTYDPHARWPDKAFRWVGEDEVNRQGIRVASAQSLVIAVRRFCREVGTGGLVLDGFEADLVTDAGRLVAVLMGGR